jgi:hypothetical protein
MEPIEDVSELRDDLLAAAHPVETPDEDGPPKRNTKQALIEKIIEVSQKEGIPLEHSNTSLKRMNKQKLSNLLAEVIETGVRRKMARQVGCEQDADNRTIALGALRMLHDVVAVGCEKAGNSFLEPRGYEIVGFSEALKEPAVSSCIDGCLREIAEENQELLEYVQSPYTRLMIAWGGAIAFSCKKKQRITQHATNLGTQKSRTSPRAWGAAARANQLFATTCSSDSQNGLIL